MSTAAVSVVIPCYNRERYVRDAIQSSLDQGSSVDEIVVVDDGSTDRTVEAARSFGTPVEVVEQENRGASAARNTGMRHATGELLVFLDSDDWLGPGTVEVHLRAVERFPDAGVYCADFGNADDQKEVTVVPSDWPEEPATPLDLLLLNPLPFPACLLYRRSAVEAVGGFDENLPSHNDCDLLIRAVLHGAKMVRSGGGYGCYRRADNSITRNRLGLHRSGLVLIEKLQREYGAKYDELEELLIERTRRHRKRYWDHILAHHWPPSPSNVHKFLYHLARVSSVDPWYAPAMLRDKPWRGEKEEGVSEKPG